MEYNNNIQKGDTDNPEQDSMVSQETIPLTEKAEKTDKDNPNETEAEESKPYTPSQVYKIQRPTLLSVLCVLTFIGSGISAFSNAVMWLSLPKLKEIVLTTGLYDSYFAMFPELETQFMTMMEVPRFFYLTSAIFYIGSVAGAVWMWNLKRKGFHLYTISQCILILISMLMMPNQGIPWGGILWTGLFVTMYATNLKYMNPQQK